MQEDVPAYTTERSPEPLASLERQAKLRKVQCCIMSHIFAYSLQVSSFQVVSPSPALSKMPIGEMTLRLFGDRMFFYTQPGLAGQHQIQNATLAVHLSDAFAKRFGEGSIILEDGSLTPDAAFGLANVKWPGRCQKVSDPVQKRLNWFLDGAHTEESLECCVRWFVSREAALSERCVAALI
jgi:folylpolyglutamate synthase/dihydropteroate synthase